MFKVNKKFVESEQARGIFNTHTHKFLYIFYESGRSLFEYLILKLEQVWWGKLTHAHELNIHTYRTNVQITGVSLLSQRFAVISFMIRIIFCSTPFEIIHTIIRFVVVFVINLG